MLEIADKINYNNLECLKDNQNATMHQNNIQSDTSMGHEASGSKQNGSKDEAVAALEALGYNRNNAIRAVNKVYNQELSTQLTTEDLIKYALNRMVKS
jgi:Holliday junction resolvasome RuvABC DNA-binding subunit